MSEDGKITQPARLYRFGVFEADTATGELRRKGLRVKLNAQPFQVLLLLMDRPGPTAPSSTTNTASTPP
jgi:DNA-binding response OmpR family regulator